VTNEEGDGQVLWQVGGRGVVYIGLWWGKVKERDHLEDLGVVGRIMY
jgi:hypothetical protein